MSSRLPLPPYAYVPGGPWPHPTRSPDGHSWGQQHPVVDPISGDQWQTSPTYLRGIALFNAGFYWEAHESWESLWHAHGRRGPTAELLQGLIKLAAAGVKVREGRVAGVRTHAVGAAELFKKSRAEAGPFQLGLDVDECAKQALNIALKPPMNLTMPQCSVACVFGFELLPRPVDEKAPTQPLKNEPCATGQWK